MSKFPDSVAAELLAACKRHCCVCLRWRGGNLQIHHIQPEAQGGPGTAENGIPVCFDCHAEIESKSNMGRRFTADELRRHREQWFGVVRDHSEKLLAPTIRDVLIAYAASFFEVVVSIFNSRCNASRSLGR